MLHSTGPMTGSVNHLWMNLSSPTNLHGSGDEGKLRLDETVVFLNSGELEQGNGSTQT